jgi:hypothetical protein
MVPAFGDGGGRFVMRPRYWLLWGALAAACAPNPASSTGVGNPGVISLSIVTDDEAESMAGEAEGGEGGAAACAANVGGALTEADAAGAPGEAVAGSPAASDDDELPRASIAHAVIVLGELRWLACDTTREPTRVSGPFIVDLIGNLVAERTRPPIPDVTEPPGGFCGLDAPLAPAAGPAEIAGSSLFFDGVRSDGTRFVLYANVEATLRVRRHGSAVWTASDTPAVLWAFRPRRWLSRMELDRTAPMPWQDGGEAVVDVNRHPLLLTALRRRLAGKSSLFSDLNKNRMLDTEDREALVGDGSDDPD